MPSLFAQYNAERERKEVLECDHGFAVFWFRAPEVCYVETLFVEKGFRAQGIATRLGDRVCEIARDRGAKWLLGSVAVNTPEATENARHLIHYGMEIDSISESEKLIYFRKALAPRNVISPVDPGVH